MLQVCRTCLNQIYDTTFVSLTSDSKSTEIKKQLAFCIPEMATNLVSEPIMCIPCVTALHAAYIFKNQCLQAEERIRNYIESRKVGLNLPDLFENPIEDETEVDEPDNINIKEEYVLPDLPNVDDDMAIENAEPKPEDNSQQDSDSQQRLRELIKKKSRLCRPNNIEKPHKCDKCPFRTTDRSTLNKHRSIHSDEKPFQCTFCKYRTKRKDALTLHMKLHKNEKPFSCPECKYCAVTKQRLRSHIMTAHLELRPFKCERCDFTAAARGTVVKHMLTHTDIKPFQCKLCNFCTKRKYTLKKHMVGHGVQ